MNNEFIINVAKLVEKLENDFGFSYDEAVNTIMLAKDLDAEGVDLDALEEDIEEDDPDEYICDGLKDDDFIEPDDEDEIEERSWDKYNRISVPNKLIRMIGADQDDEVDVFKVKTNDWRYMLIYNTNNTPHKFGAAEFDKSVVVNKNGNVRIGQYDAGECGFFWYDEDDDCIVCKY